MTQKTKTLLTALILVFGMPLAHAQQSEPESVIQTETISIEADDTVAGLGTDVVIRGLTEQAILLVFPPVGAALEQNVRANEDRVHLAGKELDMAGVYALALERNGVQLEGSAEFEVLPDQLDVSNAALQATSDSFMADGQDEIVVRVILRDRYGNPITERPVSLISSRATDAIEARTPHTDESGEQQFTIRTYEPGSIIVRAVDLISGKTISSELPLQALSPSQSMGGSAQRTMYGSADRSQTAPQYNTRSNGITGRSLYGQVISFDVVDRFIIDVPADTQVNLDENLTLTAIDRDGRVVEDYTGIVELLSTDQNAILPSFGEVQFRGADLGRKTLVLGLRFATPGEHIIYAKDTRDQSITGEAVINVIGDIATIPEQNIEIISPEKDTMVNSRDIVIEGKAPPYVNLIITGGTEDVYGESDADGYFAISVSLHPDQMDHTLRVRDEGGRHDSGNLRLKLDIEPPEILMFKITPERSVEGGDVLVTARVQDNSGIIGNITVTVNEEEHTLTPASESGSYQVLFVTNERGTYQPRLRVSDSAGNISEMLGELEVGSKSLPIVQNLQATAQPNAINLEWDELEVMEGEEPIDGYRLYVGESEADFPFTFETVEPLAEVGGLKPGTRYFFAVTAFRDEQESESKSGVVSATPLGLSLEVIPGNSSLMLKWTKLKDIPLQSFKLEYGAEPGVFTEKRSLNGDLVSYTIRDLLNDITYYVRLTPITTTGEVLDELAVEGEGTPTSALGGFQPGPADPIPHGLGTTLQPPLHSGAPPPLQPSTGIPAMGWWVVIAAIGGLGMYVRQRRRSFRTTEVFLQDMHKRYNSNAVCNQLG